MAGLCCAQLGGGSVLKRGKPNGNVHQRGAVGDGASASPPRDDSSRAQFSASEAWFLKGLRRLRVKTKRLPAETKFYV